MNIISVIIITIKMRGTADLDQQAYSTLRSFAKHRILNDMIENARRHTQRKDYIVMVLDQAALRVFRSCCKFFDVKKANISQIELLEYKRKRYPHTDALYFISPTKESINFLLQDFPQASRINMEVYISVPPRMFLMS
jgi:ribosomal protein S3AE